MIISLKIVSLCLYLKNVYMIKLMPLTLLKVVKTEVLILLDAGIIYPIYDSKWISTTQVVPKKSGITVIENENVNPKTNYT